MDYSDLERRLIHPDVSVRREALISLATLGDEAGPAMIAWLSHPDWRVRRASAIYADHHADPELLERLRLTLHDPKAKVRMWAVHSLGCEPCKPGGNPVDPVPALIHALQTDKAPRVRRMAAAMLAQQRGHRVTRALRRAQLREQDARVLAIIAWALATTEPVDPR